MLVSLLDFDDCTSTCFTCIMEEVLEMLDVMCFTYIYPSYNDDCNVMTLFLFQFDKHFFVILSTLRKFSSNCIDSFCDSWEVGNIFFPIEAFRYSSFFHEIYFAAFVIKMLKYN